MKRDPMDIAWLVETAKRQAVEHGRTHFVAFETSDKPGVQVTEHGLLEVAPVNEWRFHKRSDLRFPHLACVMVGGVRFFTVLTDEEKEGALDGTLFEGES